MKYVLLPVLPLALWHTGLKPFMRYDSFEENIAVARARGSCNFTVTSLIPCGVVVEHQNSVTWQFFVTFFGWLSDPFKG